MMQIFKNNTVSKILVLVLILCLASTGVFAQRGNKKGPTVDEFFQRFDENKDDQLTQQEFPGPDEHFSELDANGDGVIDKTEMKEVPPPPKERK